MLGFDARDSDGTSDVTVVAASRHVLFIAYYYPPSNEAGAKRALGFHRFLNEWGYRTTVITIGPETTVDLEAGVVRVSRSAFRKSLAGVAPLSSSTSRRRLARLYHEYVDIPDGYGSFFAPACAAAAEIAARDPVSAVLASSTPYTSLRIGSTLSKRLGVPWIADLRDLWTGNHFGYPYGRVRRRIDRWLERRWLQTAGRVITATRGIAAELRSSGLDLPGSTILNGYLETASYQTAPSGPFRIAFLGRLYEGVDHTPRPFFEALSTIRRDSPATFDGIRVDFFGWVNREFQEFRHSMGLETCVHYGGQVSPEEARELATRSHLLLVLLPDKPSQSVTVPTKLFDYAVTRRPVLFVGPEGEGADLVRDSGIGRAFRDSDVSGIASWVLELMRRHRGGEYPPWGDTEKVAGFHYRWRARALAAEFDLLLDGPTKDLA